MRPRHYFKEYSDLTHKIHEDKKKAWFFLVEQAPASLLVILMQPIYNLHASDLYWENVPKSISFSQIALSWAQIKYVTSIAPLPPSSWQDCPSFVRIIIALNDYLKPNSKVFYESKLKGVVSKEGWKRQHAHYHELLRRTRFFISLSSPWTRFF